MCVPIDNFVRNLSKCYIFLKSWELGKNRDFFWIWEFFWYISICNVKIHFLFKLWQKILIFEKVKEFFCFYRFTWTLTRIYESRSEHLSEKAVIFEVAKAFKFCDFMPDMMHVKVTYYRGSWKIFSIRRIKNALVLFIIIILFLEKQ